MRDAHVPPQSAVLQRLYPTLVTVKEALLLLVGAESTEYGPLSGLVVSSDPSEYTEVLLEGYRAGFSGSLPTLNGTYTLQQHSSQAEIVDRIITAQIRSGRGAVAERNILCLGSRGVISILTKLPSDLWSHTPEVTSLLEDAVIPLQQKPAHRGREAAPSALAEDCHINPSVEILKSEPWQLLLSRIGDTLMLHLLMHTAIFKPLPNGCFLQLTGAAIDQVAKKVKLDAHEAAALAPQGGKNSAQLTGQLHLASLLPGACSPLSQAHASPKAKSQASGFSDFRQRCHIMPMGATSTSGDLSSPCATSRKRAKRSARPSSWQRRRAARLLQAQALRNASGLVTNEANAHAHLQDGRQATAQQPSRDALDQHPCRQSRSSASVHCSHLNAAHACAARPGSPGMPNKRQQLMCSSEADRSPQAAATQILVDTPMELWSYTSAAPAHDAADSVPSPGATAQPVNQPECSHRAAAGGIKRQKAQQRRCLKPSEMLVFRDTLFYCSTFPAHPGFPSSYILNALHGKPGASRALYGAIFGREAVRQQVDQGQQGRIRLPQANRQHWDVPKRISAAHQPLVRALGQIIDRAKKCPFGLLLEHHCPLPPGLARTVPRGSHSVQPSMYNGQGQGSEAIPCLPRATDEQPSDGTIHIFTQAPPSLPESQKQDAMRVPDSCSNTHSSASVQGKGVSQTAPYSDGLSMERLSSAVIAHSKVTAFAWSAIRHIVPVNLLGDPGTRRSLRRAVSRLIRLRRYEHMSVQHALHGVRPSQMQALLPGLAGRRGGHGAHAAVQQRLVLWVRWLLADFLVPLLRAHFYCTESEVYRQEVFYYRKPVWLELRRQAQAKLQADVYSPLPAAEACSILQSRRLGIASLRLLPKMSGMRPIVNLGKSSRITFKTACSRHCHSLPVQRTVLSFRPVNWHLQHLHRVIQYETQRDKVVLGCSVFGYSDVYRKLRPLLQKFQELRRSCKKPAQPPQLCLISADVSQAFDSINVSKLMGIVEPLLKSPHYLIRKHAEVVPAAGSCLRSTIKTMAFEAGQPCPAFPERAKTLSREAWQKVYADKVSPARAERGQLLQLLRQHLQDGLLRIGKRWYRQARGIPQGSTLSTMLCSIFLGHLERTQLLPLLSSKQTTHSTNGSLAASGPGLTELAQAADSGSMTQRPTPTGFSQMSGVTCAPSSQGKRKPAQLQPVMLRLVDDFLILSPSRPAAEALVLCVMQGKQRTAQLQPVMLRLIVSPSGAAAEAVVLRIMQGFPDYGVHMNPAKTKVSFDMRIGGSILPRNTYIAKDGQEFLKWCGLLINVNTLELQGDYTRYAGAKLAGSLTVPLSKEPGKALAAKLCAHLRPKCHALLLDASISSAIGVRRNIFQMALLAAMKLHCQVMVLPGRQQGRQRAVASAIQYGLSYLCTLVLRRTGAGTAGLGRRTCKAISACHIRWLGLKAFQRALLKKQARYSEVLARLEAELRQPRYRQLSTQLADAVCPAQSAVFDDIIF